MRIVAAAATDLPGVVSLMIRGNYAQQRNNQLIYVIPSEEQAGKNLHRT